MPEPIIRVEGLSKRYHIGHRQGRYRTLRETIVDAVKAPWRRLVRYGRSSEAQEDVLWALKDVSFEVQRGEVLGVIGRNGAGKSTLLKVLSRITEPTRGRVLLRGRVGSLLEVGTGFHPELTGRENIFLAGVILGMRKREVSRRFDEIVAFSGVEKFIDTPMKRFSSGMQVRLGFAVAAHLDTEILLVDEVLAVGDASFQRKCLGKMGDIATQGRTVLFVSHNLEMVDHLCSRAIVMVQGQVGLIGPASVAIDHYMEELQAVMKCELADRTDRKGNGRLRFKRVELLDERGQPTSLASSGRPLQLRLHYESQPPGGLAGVHVAVGVHGPRGENLFALGTDVSDGDFETAPARGAFVCELPGLFLQPGHYPFTVFCRVQGEVADWVEDAGTIEVAGGDPLGSGKLPAREQGLMIVPHAWRLSDGT